MRRERGERVDEQEERKGQILALKKGNDEQEKDRESSAEFLLGEEGKKLMKTRENASAIFHLLGVNLPVNITFSPFRCLIC